MKKFIFEVTYGINIDKVYINQKQILLTGLDKAIISSTMHYHVSFSYYPKSIAFKTNKDLFQFVIFPIEITEGAHVSLKKKLENFATNTCCQWHWMEIFKLKHKVATAACLSSAPWDLQEWLLQVWINQCISVNNSICFE